MGLVPQPGVSNLQTHCVIRAFIGHIIFHILGLTHWGRVTHTCFTKLTTIVSDNGLSSRRCQAIFWTNTGILLIGPLETNLGEVLIEVHISSFKKMYFNMSSAKWRPFCLRLNVLTHSSWYNTVCLRLGHVYVITPIGLCRTAMVLGMDE